MKQYNFKYWLYEKDQWIITILVLMLTSAIVVSIIDIIQNDGFIPQVEFRAWVAIIAGLITLLFAFMRQKHNDMSVFFSLFEKFNSRYDELNECLNAIERSTSNYAITEGLEFKPFIRAVENNIDLKNELKEELSSEEAIKNILDDYLNLCAEEYMAYCNGYIPPEIMKYWVNGMEIFFENCHMKEYFSQELTTNSYYQFSQFACKHFDIELSNET